MLPPVDAERLRLVEIVLPYLDAKTFLRMRVLCKRSRNFIDSHEHLCNIFLKEWYIDEVISLIKSPRRQLLSVLSECVYTHILYNIESNGEYKILNNIDDITNQTKSECYRGFRIEGLKVIPFLLLENQSRAIYDRISLNPDVGNIHIDGVIYRSTSRIPDVVNKQINVPIPENVITWTDRKCYVSGVKCEVVADNATLPWIIFYNNMPHHILEHHTLYEHYPKSEFILMINIMTGEKIMRQFETDYVFKKHMQ